MDFADSSRSRPGQSSPAPLVPATLQAQGQSILFRFRSGGSLSGSQNKYHEDAKTRNNQEVKFVAETRDPGLTFSRTQLRRTIVRRMTLWILALFLAGAVAGFAAETTLTGKISDDMCGASHK